MAGGIFVNIFLWEADYWLEIFKRVAERVKAFPNIYGK